MFTYEDYLHEFDSITLEECNRIYSLLLESLDHYDDDELELYQDLLERIVSYAHVRSRWYTVMDKKMRMEEDPARTARHDHLIRGFDILARYQESKGSDTTWRDNLGEAERRKRIGDFACYIAFMYAINSR